MFAMSSTTEYPAMVAGRQFASHAQYMPARSARRSAQAMCGTWAAASATASILPIQTGVSASVFLFVLLVITGGLFLVGFISLYLLGLISLSGLTRPVISLVGLIKGLSPGTNAGD